MTVLPSATCLFEAFLGVQDCQPKEGLCIMKSGGDEKVRLQHGSILESKVRRKGAVRETPKERDVCSDMKIFHVYFTVRGECCANCSLINSHWDLM